LSTVVVAPVGASDFEQWSPERNWEGCRRRTRDSLAASQFWREWLLSPSVVPSLTEAVAKRATSWRPKQLCRRKTASPM